MPETIRNILWAGADRPTLQPYLDLVRARIGRDADYFSLADDALNASQTTKYPLVIVRDTIGVSETFLREHNLQPEDFPAFSQELIKAISSKGLNTNTPILALGIPTKGYVVPAKYIAAGAKAFWDLFYFDSREFEKGIRRLLA